MAQKALSYLVLHLYLTNSGLKKNQTMRNRKEMLKNFSFILWIQK
jgi:hypothetical protein